MTRKILLRCFLVSLLASAIVPPVTMVALAPDADEQVIDLKAIAPEKTKTLSKQEAIEYVQSIPTHRVHGIERLTYWFTNAWWLTAYWRAVLTWFLFFFGATSLVSFLNVRDHR